MSNDFIDLVYPVFKFLEDDFDYNLIDKEVSDSFDNGYLVFQSNSLKIVVIRDRSQYFIDFSSTSDIKKHFDFDVVKRYLDGNKYYKNKLFKIHSDFNPNAPIGIIADLLEQYLKRIEDSFSTSNYSSTKITLSDFQNQRAKLLFG